MRLEGVAFPAAVCGAILQINHTMWERNVPAAEPVLQGGATETAQEQGWVSVKTRCIVVVWRVLCLTGFRAAQGSLENAS